MQSVDILTCKDTNIYLFNNILSEEQCQSLIDGYKDVSERQCIVHSPELRDKLWGFIKDKISEITFLDRANDKYFRISHIAEDITLTKNNLPVGRHVDRRDDGIHFKLAFYLNTLSKNGGTVFFGDNEQRVDIKNGIGKGILFDISLSHESQKHVKGEMKYMIGARPVIKYI